MKDFFILNKDNDATLKTIALYLEITCKEHGQFPYMCDCSYYIDSNCVKTEGTNKMLNFLNYLFKSVYDLQIDLFDMLTLFFFSFLLK